MAAPSLRRSDELRARHRRIRNAGLIASVLVHGLLFVLWRGDARPISPYAAAGRRAGDDRAAPAGGGMRALRLQTVAPAVARPIPRPPAPVPVPDVAVAPDVPIEPELPPIEIADLAGVAGAAGRDEGAHAGAGIEGGTGRGDGGTEAAGRFRVIPPEPRGVILPPSDRPKEVRGKEVEVWVFVDTDGTVIPDSTRVIPSTGDAGFDRRLARQAAEWVFEPARREGRAIAEWFRYVISL
ncbi:MAG TPA: hypothetical protein VF158_06535 [Longimicrobiales bacterium]